MHEMRLSSVGGGAGGRRSRLRELLAGKEGLGLPTGGVGAQRTAEGQLAGADHVGPQVGLDQVCQSLEGWRDLGGITALLPQQSLCIPSAAEAPE